MHVDAVAFLASGWSLATPSAHGTAIGLATDEGTILVDAGGEVTKGLVASFGDEDLRHVYLTHEHPDHTWGLPGLVHHLRFAGERGLLTVHGPAPALERVRAGLDVLGVTCPFELRWEEIDPEGGSDARARWAPTEHSVPTVAYRFGDVVVCGDTGPSASVAQIAEEASLLVHEASHTSESLTHDSGHSTPGDAGEVASRARVGLLALIHVHPDLGQRGAIEACPFEDTIAPVDGALLQRIDGGWQEDKGRP